MTPIIRAYWAPKAAAEEREWEDAAAYDEARGVAAVADGASSSYRAGRWSALLVEEFLKRPPQLSPDLSEFHRWVATVAEGFQTSSEAVSDTSWYASDASRRGSFATFVGTFLLSGVGGTRFIGVQLGDACLFHTRGEQLVSALPTRDAEGFDSTPSLLSSSPYEESYGAEAARYCEGDLRPGDCLYLTTDAFGSAMLALAEAEQPIWTAAADFGPNRFTRIVDELRAVEVLEDDDVTLVRIQLQESQS
ncbi:MAG: protein phosphatase 2C domain-containing protein [Microthrixaceae bacterium]